MASKIGKLNPSRTILLLCDIQEKFAKNIQYFNEITANSIRVLEACKLIGVPVLATEQYPKGFNFKKFKFKKIKKYIDKRARKNCPHTKPKARRRPHFGQDSLQYVY